MDRKDPVEMFWEPEHSASGESNPGIKSNNLYTLQIEYCEPLNNTIYIFQKARNSVVYLKHVLTAIILEDILE